MNELCSICERPFKGPGTTCPACTRYEIRVILRSLRERDGTVKCWRVGGAYLDDIERLVAEHHHLCAEYDDLAKKFHMKRMPTGAVLRAVKAQFRRTA